MNGRGTLSRLEGLKRKYGPEFRAKAKSRRRITEACLEIKCDLALSRLVFVGGRLKIVKTTCYRKRCPREEKE